MLITPKIYRIILLTAKRIAKRSPRYYYEDLAQTVCLKLMAYDGPRIDYPVSFINSCVKNEYLNYLTTSRRVYTNKIKYAYLQPASDSMDISGIIESEYKEAFKVFDKKPKRRKVLDLVLEQPDVEWAVIAREQGMSTDTFKAHMRFVQQDLKSIGITL